MYTKPFKNTVVNENRNLKVNKYRHNDVNGEKKFQKEKY